eukprot:782434-Amphidinium_carterae.1
MGVHCECYTESTVSIWDQTRMKELDPGSGGSFAGRGAFDPKEDLPPWDQYIKVNAHFARHGNFMHTVAWEALDIQV